MGFFESAIVQEEDKKLFGIKKLNIPRSSLPAITHVDYSARVQTVTKTTNSRYYNLISAFKQKTGCPTIVNTSFNIRGEPIVCTPQDAYRCFMRTEMDILVLQNQILFKSEQLKVEKDDLNSELFWWRRGAIILGVATTSLSILTEIKTGISLIIEFIFKSLDVLNTLDDGTVPIGLKSLSTINISKNSSGKSLFSLK